MIDAKVLIGRDWADAGLDMTDEDVAASFAAALPVRTQIEVRQGELHLIAIEAENALVNAKASLFVLGGRIVRPILDDMPAFHGRRTKVARLAELDADGLIYHLSRTADWVKFNARKKSMVPCDPPRSVALTILSRDGEWLLPKLAGLMTTPTLRPDGTVLWEAGYDGPTQLLLLDPPPMPPMPDKPTRADAEASLRILEDLLAEFPFVDGPSRSVALSALITPVARAAMQVAPLHAMTGPVAGSGKSYLIDLVSGISVGQPAPVIAAGRNEEETEKRLGAALLNGQPIVSIDNLNGELGGDALCQMIERPAVSVRVLGSSQLITLENRATFFATGNNIHLVGDMTRRALLCRLDPNMERPELRHFQYSPFNRVLADRGKFVAAVLTIVRAYIVAGCPNALQDLASFGDWSRIVRSPIVWLGRDDPVQTMEAARADDPVLFSARNLFSALHAAVGGGKRTAGQIKQLADQSSSIGKRLYDDLHRALYDVADDGRGGIDPRRLGKWLGRHKGRIVDGLKLQGDEDSHSKQMVWSVVRV